MFCFQSMWWLSCSSLYPNYTFCLMKNVQYSSFFPRIRKFWNKHVMMYSSMKNTFVMYISEPSNITAVINYEAIKSLSGKTETFQEVFFLFYCKLNMLICTLTAICYLNTEEVESHVRLQWFYLFIFRNTVILWIRKEETKGINCS